jgi:hypothetical protein
MCVGDIVRMKKPLLTKFFFKGKMKIFEIKDDFFKIGLSESSGCIWVQENYLEKYN